MLSTRCQSCGHRILHAAALQCCPNCGAPFLPTAAPPSPSLSEAGSYPVPNAPGRIPQSTLASTSLQPSSEERALVRRATTTPDQPFARSSALEPYADHTPRHLYQAPWQEGDASSFYAPSVIEVQELLPQMTDPLPWWFPRRPPDIAGVLIHIQSQQERQPSFDLLGSLFKLLTDMIWSIPGDQSHSKDAEPVVVTTLRIRTGNGVQKDARLHGYLTGANLTLGDTISLWGRKRKGILLVGRGYNHTSKSVIATRATPSFFFALLMLALIALALYVLVFGQNVFALFLPR